LADKDINEIGIKIILSFFLQTHTGPSPSSSTPELKKAGLIQPASAEKMQRVRNFASPAYS
jgi:hypothetical protein